MAPRVLVANGVGKRLGEEGVDTLVEDGVLMLVAGAGGSLVSPQPATITLADNATATRTLGKADRTACRSISRFSFFILTSQQRARQEWARIARVDRPKARACGLNLDLIALCNNDNISAQLLAHDGHLFADSLLLERIHVYYSDPWEITVQGTKTHELGVKQTCR